MSDSAKVTGVIKRVGDVQEIPKRSGGGAFIKRTFVLTLEPGQYEQSVEFELFGEDKVKLADPIKAGDIVTVHYNLRGREWAKTPGDVRVFNTLNVWKIDLDGAAKATEKPAPTGVDDDIPF